MSWPHALRGFRDWMREDDLDLRNPLSVLGTRRLEFENLLTDDEPDARRPDGLPVWEYLIASSASTARGRHWELVGRPTYFYLPHNATLEYLVGALSDFGWQLLGATGADYVFRRPTPFLRADRPGLRGDQV